MQPPAYFEQVHKRTIDTWDVLDERPDLAGPWHQLFNQVQSPKHVVSELLQNADDAGATEASISIQNGEFIFEHNGEDFTEEHFNSLCNFGFSNKRSLHTIGFRGIGFKSSFSLGDEVKLQTPSLSVAFHRSRFTEPSWIESNERCTKTSVRVVIKDDYRRVELEKNLVEWLRSPVSLLFFHNVRALAIDGEIVRWVSCGSGPIPGSAWMALDSNLEKKYLVIRSSEEYFPAEALEEIRQERMVSSQDETPFPPCRIDIVLGLEGRLFVILPTGAKTDLPFACNAPFLQDPARFKIKAPELSPTNRWLLARAGELAATAMLAWVNDSNLETMQRVLAYELLPDVDRKDNSLEGACATIVETAFEGVIKESNFVMTEEETLASWGECLAVPGIFLQTWRYDQVISFFASTTTSILTHLIPETLLNKLINWRIVNQAETSQVLNILSNIRLPRPETWRKLMFFWAYVFNISKYHWSSFNISDAKIVPVQGEDYLYPAKEVVRLGEKKLLNSTEDWNFLAKYLLVLNQNWPRFLADQKRKYEEQGDESLGQEVESAYELLKKFDLVESSDVSDILAQVAEVFFSQTNCSLHDCIRLAQIAASLGASVSKNFQFVTQDGYRRSLNSNNQLIADFNSELDLFVENEWYDAHVLHADYNLKLGCSEPEWRQWITSGKSGLMTFVPIVEVHHPIWGRSALEQELKRRGASYNGYVPYKTNQFILKDCDFTQEHWRFWSEIAKDNGDFWATLLSKIIKQPEPFFKNAYLTQAIQVATTGNTRPVTYESFCPAWILKFKKLPCLRDNRGRYQIPEELLCRTPETEPLLDIEPFVNGELDTEKNRPFLKLLGVRSNPTNPMGLIKRLIALSEVPSPPVYEIEKWYHRLDKMFNHCSTEEREIIKNIFARTKIIFSDANSWVTSKDVFLAVDAEDFPDFPTIHSSLRHLSLWEKLGVSTHPTIELSIRWLQNLNSGKILTADESRKVRSLLKRYPQRIWEECSHWLNLNGEWVPTNCLSYSLTMQTLIPWKHLFSTIKQKTADLQMLTEETCEQFPFNSLNLLANEIKECLTTSNAIENTSSIDSWLNILGFSLSRISLDDQEEMKTIQQLGISLGKTIWQPVSNLKTTPYIESTPAGVAREANALWKEDTLYVSKASPAKMAKEVVQELSKRFKRQDVSEAIKFCYERQVDFIEEYMESNFTLLPKEPLSPGEEKHYGHEESTISASSTPKKIEEIQSDDPNESLPAFAIEASSIQDDATEERDSNSQEFPGDGKTIMSRKHTPSTIKPKLFETFATSRGYIKDKLSGNFFRNDGFKISFTSEFSFPWQEFSNGGELVQSYWDKDICIEYCSLQIAAEVWELCIQSPKKYSLILAGLDGSPKLYTGTQICRLRDCNEIQLFPSAYSLVYTNTER